MMLSKNVMMMTDDLKYSFIIQDAHKDEEKRRKVFLIRRKKKIEKNPQLLSK